MPSNNQFTTLGKLAQFEMGQSPDSSSVKEEAFGLPFLQGSAEFGEMWPQHRQYCTRPKKTCQPGDVLISVRAPVGTINKADQVYCIGRGLAAVHFSNTSPEFGWHLLSYWAPNLRLVAQGSTFEAVGKAELQNLRVVYVPQSDQRRIAEILDTMDEAIQQTEAIIGKLQLMKQGILLDLLTRGINEDGKLRDPVAHPNQFKDSDLGPIPNSWNIRTMEELTTKIVDGVHHTPKYVDSGIPFLTVENLTAGSGISLDRVRYITASDHAVFSKRADPKPGDVVVSKDGTLGVARVVTDNLPEFSIFVSVAQLRTNQKLVLPSFIRTFFETKEYKQQLATRSAGTGLKHIHLEHFRMFRLPTPPLDEQNRIFTILDSQDTRIRTEEEYRDKLKRQKQGLMHDLLTGKVRVDAIEAGFQ